MIAFISDLHSNLEALEAAFRDIDEQGVEQVVCLGDIIGYGASPIEVIRRTRERCQVALLGNHDAALLDDQEATGFNERALLAIDFTRRAMDPELEENWELWDWIGGLVPAMELSQTNGHQALQLVHASPREPLSEYLMPNSAKTPEKLRANFNAARHRVSLFGHTHHPGYFAEGDAFVRADDSMNRLRLQPDRRYLVNVGSVGQPRDGDPRLCYAILDGDEIRWRRLAYDVESAKRRIDAAEGLPASLGERLLVGR